MATFKHGYETARDTAGHTIRTGQAIARLALLGLVTAGIAGLVATGSMALAAVGGPAIVILAPIAGFMSVKAFVKSKLSLPKKGTALGLSVAGVGLGVAAMATVIPMVTLPAMVIGTSAFAITALAFGTAYKNTWDSIQFHGARILPRNRTSRHSPSLTMPAQMRKELDDMAKTPRSEQAKGIAASSAPLSGKPKKNINDLVVTVRDGRY